MEGDIRITSGARIEKTKQAWKLANRNTFRNKVSSRKTKMLRRDPLIRRTVIYGLRAKDLPRHLMNKLGTYMYNDIRMMMNPKWEIDARYSD